MVGIVDNGKGEPPNRTRSPSRPSTAQPYKPSFTNRPDRGYGQASTPTSEREEAAV